MGLKVKSVKKKKVIFPPIDWRLQILLLLKKEW